MTIEEAAMKLSEAMELSKEAMDLSNKAMDLSSEIIDSIDEILDSIGGKVVNPKADEVQKLMLTIARKDLLIDQLEGIISEVVKILEMSINCDEGDKNAIRAFIQVFKDRKLSFDAMGSKHG